MGVLPFVDPAFRLDNPETATGVVGLVSVPSPNSRGLTHSIARFRRRSARRCGYPPEEICGSSHTTLQPGDWKPQEAFPDRPLHVGSASRGH